MRVAVDVQPLATTGGIATYTRCLVDHLEGVDVVPVFGALRGEERVRQSLQSRHQDALLVPPRPWRVLARARWLNGFIPGVETYEKGLRLVHGTNYFAPPTRLPRVVTVHDLSALRHPELHTGKVRAQGFEIAKHAAAARLVIADSTATADDLMAVLAVPAARIRVIHLASQIVPPADPLPILSLWHLEPGTYILHVGALEPRKNLPRLIEAFLLCEAARHLRLVLAGPHAWGSEAIVKASKVDPRIVLLGEVPLEDLPSLYAGAACFAYPSLFEGFGFPPLEAMACGTPVLAGRSGSLPEVVGEAGLLVDPRDVQAIRAGLARILTEPGLAADLARRGVAQAAGFTWRQTADATRDVYAEVLGAR